MSDITWHPAAEPLESQLLCSVSMGSSGWNSTTREYQVTNSIFQK